MEVCSSSLLMACAANTTEKTVLSALVLQRVKLASSLAAGLLETAFSQFIHIKRRCEASPPPSVRVAEFEKRVRFCGFCGMLCEDTGRQSPTPCTTRSDSCPFFKYAAVHAAACTACLHCVHVPFFWFVFGWLESRWGSPVFLRGPWCWWGVPRPSRYVLGRGGDNSNLKERP